MNYLLCLDLTSSIGGLKTELSILAAHHDDYVPMEPNGEKLEITSESENIQVLKSLNSNQVRLAVNIVCGGASHHSGYYTCMSLLKRCIFRDSLNECQNVNAIFGTPSELVSECQCFAYVLVNIKLYFFMLNIILTKEYTIYNYCHC